MSNRTATIGALTIAAFTLSACASSPATTTPATSDAPASEPVASSAASLDTATSEPSAHSESPSEAPGTDSSRSEAPGSGSSPSESSAPTASGTHVTDASEPTATSADATSEPAPVAPSVSLGRGIYSAPIDVTITHPSAATVRYTLDASDPRGPSAVAAELPLTLHVDPHDVTGRYVAPGVVLRLTVDGVNATAGSVQTHTFLFPSELAALSPDNASPGAGWPEVGDVQGVLDESPQVIDYGIDPDVAAAPEYESELPTAIDALPSISLVTDLPNLFDSETGIYVNAMGRGEEWERFASFEILDPTGETLQANAGVRIRGGSSREGDNPKHGFRLFFRETYGVVKLEHPLFGADGVSVFDKLDLRTSQNYSWSKDSQEAATEAIFVRDSFSRKLQGLLGHPHTRSRAYHLYLDGVYWGLFETEERPDAHFGADYLGGSRSNFDTIKVASDLDFTLEVADGTFDAWQAVWDLCEQGFAADENYRRLEGLNATAERDAALPVLVDIGNLIDYMLLVFYTANFDAPVSKWFDNQSPNNFFALRDRTADRGFVFVAHDNEHSLFAEPLYVTNGLQEDRVNIGYPDGAKNGEGEVERRLQMEVTEFARFHPQWLHHRLTENALYRERFAARAHTLLDGSGSLTAASVLPVFDALIAEIGPAVVAESARWGDAHDADAPRTKQGDWQPAVSRVRDGFLASRTEVVIDQLRAAELY